MKKYLNSLFRIIVDRKHSTWYIQFAEHCCINSEIILSLSIPITSKLNFFFNTKMNIIQRTLISNFRKMH